MGCRNHIPAFSCRHPRRHHPTNSANTYGEIRYETLGCEYFSEYSYPLGLLSPYYMISTSNRVFAKREFLGRFPWLKTSRRKSFQFFSPIFLLKTTFPRKTENLVGTRKFQGTCARYTSTPENPSLAHAFDGILQAFHHGGFQGWACEFLQKNCKHKMGTNFVIFSV